jgi:fatty acid desaturase
MPARQQRLLIVSAAITSALLLLGAFAGHEELLAYAAPVLVLVLPLLSGRFVGEEQIARAVAGRRARTMLHARSAATPTWSAGVLSVPRGGRLIAQSLAVRPPPAAASM